MIRISYYAKKNTIEEQGTVEELQSHMCLFENQSDGPRIGADTAKLRCKMSQNVAFRIKKGGKKFCPPIFLAVISDLKFHVDFDFAIKLYII